MPNIIFILTVLIKPAELQTQRYEDASYLSHMLKIIGIIGKATLKNRSPCDIMPNIG